MFLKNRRLSSDLRQTSQMFRQIKKDFFKIV